MGIKNKYQVVSQVKRCQYTMVCQETPICQDIPICQDTPIC